MIKKRLTGLLLILALLLLTSPAVSAETDLPEQVHATDLTVSTSTPLGYTYSPDDGSFLFTEPGRYTVAMQSGITATTRHKIRINGGTAVDPVIITLDQVQLQNDGCALELMNTAYLVINLQADTGSVLTSGGSYPGILCESGTTLVINGPGSLTATGSTYGAGIGSRSLYQAGSVIINGGTITATGGSYGGAGIGGGYHGGDGGQVTIHGGTVTAKSGIVTEESYGEPGAGIGGGGYQGDGGQVTITGGTVTAIGGSIFYDREGTYLDVYEGGAGIGGGYQGAGGNVIITGGSVKVSAGYGADGIGGGTDQSGTGSLSNGHQAISLRAIYDAVLTTNPEEVSYEIPMIVGGEKTSYRYTGKGHGSNDTTLYFYLPLGVFTTTSLSASQDAVRTGEAVTFTATVTTVYDQPALFGEVAFYAGETLLATQAIDYSSGTATYTTDSLATATHLIKAKYFGDEGNYFGSHADVLDLRVVEEPVYNISDGDINITAGGTYRITGSTTAYAITIQTASAVTLILDNVSIDFASSSVYRCPLDSGANVILLLEGTNTLNCCAQENTQSGYTEPGIKVEGSDRLIIDNDTGRSGTLTVSGGYDRPGIGSGNRTAVPGTITIRGGTVSVTGGQNGAGIGGGEAGAGGMVILSGGTVFVQGGNQASGIGGGYGGAGGTVTVSGGYLTATGGDEASGIGGGEAGAGGSLQVSNGTITAKGGSGGAGIGGGDRGAGAQVKITGGSIKAVPGSESAEAIGHGAYGGLSGTLTNGYADLALRVFADRINPENPQDVNIAETVTGNGYSYVYQYTGRGHGSGDTNLYFYLPVTNIGQTNPPIGDTEDNPPTGRRSFVLVWLLICMAAVTAIATLLLSGRNKKAGQR